MARGCEADGGPLASPPFRLGIEALQTNNRLPGGLRLLGGDRGCESLEAMSSSFILCNSSGERTGLAVCPLEALVFLPARLLPDAGLEAVSMVSGSSDVHLSAKMLCTAGAEAVSSYH
jgi:hypothetical protein